MALTAKRMDRVRQDIPLAAITKGDIVRVGLNVTEQTRARWKMAALARGITLAELIETSVDAVIASQQ